MSHEEPISQEAFRQKLLAEIPSWYRPYLHLALPSLFGLAAVFWGLMRLQDIQWWEWLFFPASYVFANMLEWVAHKQLLHTRRFWAVPLYEQHTPMHHRVYTTEKMNMQDPREFRLILLPPYGIGLIPVISLPITLLLRNLVSPNAGWIFLVTAMAYVVGYEWLHLSYHLPEGHPIGRLSLIRRLSHHHAIHHNPALMQRWNMNVTIPLWDWVMGTIYRQKQ